MAAFLSRVHSVFYIKRSALGPGLQVLGYYANSLALIQSGTWLAVPVNSLIFASIVNVLFTLLVLTGIRKTFSALNIMWVITLLGTFVMIGALIATTHSGFESAFNGFMARSNGTSTLSNSFSFVQNSIPAASLQTRYPRDCHSGRQRNLGLLDCLYCRRNTQCKPDSKKYFFDGGRRHSQRRVLHHSCLSPLFQSWNPLLVGNHSCGYDFRSSFQFNSPGLERSSSPFDGQLRCGSYRS